jgi:hypothetical protein
MLEIGLGNTPARDIWRKLMKNGSYFPGRGTIVEESFLQGKVETLVNSVLSVLRHRQVAVSDEVRERISACQDVDTLERWMDRAFSVTTADELIEEPSP